MELASMKLSAERQKEYGSPTALEGDMPAYPYGLCIHLGEDQIKQLGIAAMPSAGQAMTLIARVEVKNAGVRDTAENGKIRDMDLQITDMALAPEAKKESAADKIYGG